MSLPPSVTPSTSVTNMDVMMTLIRLETKVDVFCSQQADHEQRIRLLEVQATENSDHDKRIGELEKRRWPIPAAGLLVSVGSLALAGTALLGR